MITEFLLSCQAKNIKLKPSKFFISTCVEFGGCRISADRLRDKGFIFIKPKEGRVRAFSELKRPSTKREAQVWAGMVSSLSAWAPATICCYYYILHAPKLRLYSDCKGLAEMYKKDLTKVTNPKHFRILSDIQCITFHEVTYIPGEANILADALSRLCKHLRVEGREMENV